MGLLEALDKLEAACQAIQEAYIRLIDFIAASWDDVVREVQARIEKERRARLKWRKARDRQAASLARDRNAAQFAAYKAAMIDVKAREQMRRRKVKNAAGRLITHTQHKKRGKPRFFFAYSDREIVKYVEKVHKIQIRRLFG